MNVIVAVVVVVVVVAVIVIAITCCCDCSSGGGDHSGRNSCICSCSCHQQDYVDRSIISNSRFIAYRGALPHLLRQRLHTTYLANSVRMKRKIWTSCSIGFIVEKQNKTERKPVPFIGTLDACSC